MSKAILKLYALVVLAFCTSATSCVFPAAHRVSYALNACPDKEFLLPYSVQTSDLSAKLSWMEDSPAQYAVDWKNTKASDRVYAFIEYGKDCRLVFGVHTRLQGTETPSKEELDIKINEAIDKLNKIASALLNHSKFKVKTGEYVVTSFKDYDEFKEWLLKNSVKPYNSISRL